MYIKGILKSHIRPCIIDIGVNPKVGDIVRYTKNSVVEHMIIVGEDLHKDLPKSYEIIDFFVEDLKENVIAIWTDLPNYIREHIENGVIVEGEEFAIDIDQVPSPEGWQIVLRRKSDFDTHEQNANIFAYKILDKVKNFRLSDRRISKYSLNESDVKELKSKFKDQTEEIFACGMQYVSKNIIDIITKTKEEEKSDLEILFNINNYLNTLIVRK